MDDLKTIVEYHEQMLRSLESQINEFVGSLSQLEQDREAARRQREEERRVADQRMAHIEMYLQRAFRMGVAAMRRERKARLEADHDLKHRGKRTGVSGKSATRASNGF